MSSAEVAGDEVLRVQHLSKSFVDGPMVVRACDEVNMRVGRGEFCLVRGPSGSGKSTMLQAFAGLLPVDGGVVEVDGRVVSGASEADRAAMRLRSVGVVFQDFLLIEEYSAVENVVLPLEARGWSRLEARDEALKWLEEVGLGEMSGRRPYQLSGGQRQRVGVARALAGGRRLILADEPTGSLDSATSREVFDLLARMAASGVAVVLASHDPQAQDVADRTFLMRDGRLEELSA